MFWSRRRWALSSLAGLSCPRWQKAQSVPLRQAPWAMSTQGLRHNSGCPWLPVLKGADGAGGPSGESKPGGGRKYMVTLLGGSRHCVKIALDAKVQGDLTRISGVSCIIIHKNRTRSPATTTVPFKRPCWSRKRRRHGKDHACIWSPRPRGSAYPNITVLGPRNHAGYRIWDLIPPHLGISGW